MATIQVTCKCGAEFEVEVTEEGGDVVPYGSTTARTPTYMAAEIIEQRCFCPMDDAFEQIIIDQAITQAEEYEEPESQYDTTAERDMDRRA